MAGFMTPRHHHGRRRALPGDQARPDGTRLAHRPEGLAAPADPQLLGHHAPGRPARFGTLLLAPNQDRNQCQLQIGDRLGERTCCPPIPGQPVYILQWRDRDRYRSGGDPVNALLTLTLERVSPAVAGPATPSKCRRPSLSESPPWTASGMANPSPPATLNWPCVRSKPKATGSTPGPSN